MENKARGVETRTKDERNTKYRSNALEQVLGQIRYSKRTLSFLRNILNYYGVPNELDKYLSSLSGYKHPTMEVLYETASVS